jgi:hypothetical protein
VDLKIRKLKKRDQKRLSGIFKAIAKSLKKDYIRELMRSKGDDGKQMPEDDRKAAMFSAIIKIISDAAGSVKTEIDLFFADLCGMTIEEYEEQDIDIDMQVLNALKEAPEAVNFFNGALRPFRGMQGLSGVFEELRSYYDTTTK